MQRLQDKKNLMPVRILCYDTGAMLLTICGDNDLSANRKVGLSKEYLLPEEVFRKITPDYLVAADTEMEAFYRTEIRDFKAKTERIIKSSEPVAEGDFELVGVNIYSARYLNGYIYSEYFVRYKAKEMITLYGNYLLRMRQNKVTAVWVPVGGIDPSLLFDGDRVYYCTNQSLHPGREEITLEKIDVRTGRLLGAQKTI